MNTFAPSARARNVQLPIIPTVAGWIAETPGTISLGQGVAYYGPPPEAVKAVESFLAAPGSHTYKPDAGLPELRAAFETKLRTENGIDAPFERRIIVTAGAPEAPETLKAQLTEGGRLVIPVGPRYSQTLFKITRHGRDYQEEDVTGCVFVPLVGDFGWREE